MSKIEFSSLGKEVTVRISFEQFSTRDQINILWELLNKFDPGVGGNSNDYEEYQKAAGIVLAEANKQWDKPK